MSTARDMLNQGSKSNQILRSQTSSNWRVKDETPRTPRTPQPQPQPYTKSRSESVTATGNVYLPRGEFPERQQSSSTKKVWTNSTSRKPHSGDPSNRLVDPTYPSDTRVYVGNLAYSVQPEVIKQLLADNGFPNVGIIMSIDPFSGRNPSYCFVDFEDADEAKKAIDTLNGIELAGRPIKANQGTPKRPPKTDTKVKNWSWGKAPNVGTLSPSVDDYTPVFDRWSRTDASDFWFGQSTLGKRLYVGGLPRIENIVALDAEIQSIFHGFKIEAISKLISPHKSKQSEPGNHYFLFVDLETSEEASRAAAALNEQPTWWGGKLKVSKAKPGSNSKRVLREQPSQLELQQQQMGGGGGGPARGGIGERNQVD